MPQYPPEYEEFAGLVKQHVIYTLLLKVLPGERKRIGEAAPKLVRGYVSLLEDVEKPIEQELRWVRMRMRHVGGKIVEEKQEEHTRKVISLFRGYTYTHSFSNVSLLSECEEAVKSFLRGDATTITPSPGSYDQTMNIDK